MGLLLFLHAFSMAAVTCTLYAAITTGGITLSADADPIPGGYVVLEGCDVTFICNSSSGRDLFWRVNVTNGIYRRHRTDILGLKGFKGFSSPDESADTNPATFTFHNISLENNPSPVECSDPSIQDKSKSQAILIIIVEGSPNCPTLNTTVNITSLTVSIQKTQMVWLPEWYSVQVLSCKESIGIVVYNSTLKGPGPFDMTSLEPGTVYNISVMPCNMAGCNKSCDVHSVQTESETVRGTRGPVNTSMSDDGITFAVLAAVVLVVALLAIAMVTTAMVIGACTYKRKQKPGKVGGGEGHYEDIEGIEPPTDDLVATTSLREPIVSIETTYLTPSTMQAMSDISPITDATGGGEGHYEDIEGVNSPYDDLVAMSTSLQGPNSSSVDTVRVHQASSQLHSGTSATAAQYVNEGVTSTNDITMEDNPAYQSIEVAGTETSTTESTQSDYI